MIQFSHPTLDFVWIVKAGWVVVVVVQHSKYTNTEFWSRAQVIFSQMEKYTYFLLLVLLFANKVV